MENIQYKNYTIKIEHDQEPENPREWDNVGTMMCWHSRLTLGDNHRYHDYEDFLSEHNISDLFILPLYLIDHSGLSMKTTSYNDKWDSGQVGYIYCSREDAQKAFPNVKNFKILKSKIYKLLESEVAVYSQYLEGDIYGYDIEALEESLWGIYGYNEAVKQAKEAIDYFIANTKEYLLTYEITGCTFIRAENEIEARELLQKKIEKTKKVFEQVSILKSL